MQTKFSALIPPIFSGQRDLDATTKESIYFWHSFFLLKPEFIVVQNSLASNYSLEAIHKFIKICLHTIASSDQTQVAKLKRANASYLLVQIFESIWSKIRSGTFGVDAINFLCNIDEANQFFDEFIYSILSTKDPEPVLVLLSLLSATGDIETNALVDFFTERCHEITNYCMVPSDLHLLLFSLLFQINRPNGPFTQEFNTTNHSILSTFVTNLISRSSQLYFLCRPQKPQSGWFIFKKPPTNPPTAKLGFLDPSDFQLPVYFSLFEPFIDAGILCFYEFSLVENNDSTLISAMLTLFSHIIASSSTPHSGDRLLMMLISISFLFDKNPSAISLPFDYTQFRSCFNTLVSECKECSIGAMTLELISCLLEKEPPVTEISPIIGRIIYQILFIMTQFRGTHNVSWHKLFERIFGFCKKVMRSECAFNSYVMAIIAVCTSFRAALFKKDDGFIELLCALAKNPSIALAFCEPINSLSNSAAFIKKCKDNVVKIVDGMNEDMAEMQFAQMENALKDMKIECVKHEEFPEIEPQNECPNYTEFLHVYSRQHCENIRALLHYTISHI